MNRLRYSPDSPAVADSLRRIGGRFAYPAHAPHVRITMHDQPTAILSAIQFQCSCCRQQLRVAPQFAGTLVRCPVCRSLANVPGEATTAVASPDDPTPPLRPKTRTHAATPDSDAIHFG